MKIQSELTWEPSVNVIETEDELIVMVDLAGMVSKDIDVVTDGKILKISGFRKDIFPACRKQFHKLEIQVGHFERKIELPVTVDHSEVSARYSRGMLNIRIRKIDPSKHTRRVPID